jgi:hypothetical protein
VNARSTTYRENRIDRESKENNAYDAVKPGKEGQHLLFPRLQLTRVVALERLDRRTVKPSTRTSLDLHDAYTDSLCMASRTC